MSQIKTRDELKVHLKGEGIEIGALHRPLDVSGLKVKVKYLDWMDEEGLKKIYKEYTEMPWVKIDIVDVAEKMTKVKDNSQDFIIANHVIEHMTDPVGALITWHRKLKVGGNIFMAVPDKRFTFDLPRPLTSLQHLVYDNMMSENERLKVDRDHFREWARMLNHTAEDEVEARVDELIDTHYSIHYHTFTPASFEVLIAFLRDKLAVKYKIVDYSDTAPGGHEFIYVLRKDGVSPLRQVVQKTLVRTWHFGKGVAKLGKQLFWPK